MITIAIKYILFITGGVCWAVILFWIWESIWKKIDILWKSKTQGLRRCNNCSNKLRWKDFYCSECGRRLEKDFWEITKKEKEDVIDS